MEQDILNEPLRKERSYVKSISAGTRLPLRHPWGFLRQLWPLWLLNTLIWALVSRMVACDLYDFCHTSMAEGVTPTDLIGPSLFKVLAWGLLAFVLLGIWCGQACFLMRRYAELTYLPAIQPWKIWRDILPVILRGMLVFIVGYLVAAGCSVACLAILPSRIWALCAFIIVLIFWVFICIPGGTRYLMDASSSFVSSMNGTIKKISHLGSWCAIISVSGIVVILLVLIASVPTICATYVNGLSDMSVAIGDGTDVPASFAYLRAASFALTFFIAPIAWTFLLIPLCFNWGSECAIVETVEEKVS